MRQVAMMSELRDGGLHGVEIDGESVLLLRDGDTVRAFSGKCPHAGAPLDEGALCEGRIVCPWHKSMFSAVDGCLLEPPALDGLRRYPVHVEDGAVRVGLDPVLPSPHPTTGLEKLLVIVGGGAAGTAAAAALREFGFAGRLLVIGGEPDSAYDRTALSKFVLEGGMAPDEVPPLRPPGFWVQHRIDRTDGRVRRLDAAERRIELEDGCVISFDAALLATGGQPRPLHLPGASLPGVQLLRSRANAAAIVARLDDTPPTVIVGGGFIALEAASALRQRGCDVTVVTTHPVPLEHQLGREVASALRRLHERNGVRFVVGEAAAIEGPDAVGAVLLADGTRLDARLVIAATGVSPATGMLSGLDLEADGGVPVDAGMRTAAAGLFAAGDIAAFPFGPGPSDSGPLDPGPSASGRTRIEHWRVAQQHARVAARNMLGDDVRFEQPPFFWTYHYGKRIEVHGHPHRFDRMEIEGDLDSFAFIGRQLRDGELVGLVACDRDADTAALAHTVPARP
jgi:apoptosis-inducing factor 3